MKLSKHIIFATISIVLIIFAFLSIKYSQNTTVLDSKTSPVEPTTQKENIEWKTYLSMIDNKLSFKYPSNWKIKINKKSQNTENITFTSPNGFEFEYLFTGTQGGPNICTGEKYTCPKITNYSSKSIFVNGWKTLYVVNGSLYMNISPNTLNEIADYKAIYLSEIEKPDSAVEAGAGVGFNSYIKSKNYPAKYIVMTGKYPTKSSQQKLDYKEYFELEDIQTATEIMESLSY